MFELPNDEITSVFGPGWVLRFGLIVHLAIMSDDDASVDNERMHYPPGSGSNSPRTTHVLVIAIPFLVLCIEACQSRLRDGIQETEAVMPLGLQPFR